MALLRARIQLWRESWVSAERRKGFLDCRMKQLGFTLGTSFTSMVIPFTIFSRPLGVLSPGVA